MCSILDTFFRTVLNEHGSYTHGMHERKIWNVLGNRRHRERDSHCFVERYHHSIILRWLVLLWGRSKISQCPGRSLMEWILEEERVIIDVIRRRHPCCCSSPTDQKCDRGEAVRRLKLCGRRPRIPDVCTVGNFRKRLAAPVRGKAR